MKDYAPVHVESAAGDFSVTHLTDTPDWIVSCHHPDILTYVAPDEVETECADIQIDFIGRSKREQDARELKVIHAEDEL